VTGRTIRSVRECSTTSVVGAVALVLLSFTPARAQDRPLANLKDVPRGQQVTGVGYCRGQYDVTLGDGSARTFKEYHLAFKIDSSANGPRPAHPALVPTGRVGDRAFVVFADLDELRGTVQAACRD